MKTFTIKEVEIKTEKILYLSRFKKWVCRMLDIEPMIHYQHYMNFRTDNFDYLCIGDLIKTEYGYEFYVYSKGLDGYIDARYINRSYESKISVGSMGYVFANSFVESNKQ